MAWCWWMGASAVLYVVACFRDVAIGCVLMVCAGVVWAHCLVAVIVEQRLWGLLLWEYKWLPADLHGGLINESQAQLSGWCLVGDSWRAVIPTWGATPGCDLWWTFAVPTRAALKLSAEVKNAHFFLLASSVFFPFFLFALQLFKIF